MKNVSKINQILNIIIGVNVGVFIGHGISVINNYYKYPDLYAMQSSPWYGSIITYGILTGVLIILVLVIKYIILHKKY